MKLRKHVSEKKKMEHMYFSKYRTKTINIYIQAIIASTNACYSARIINLYADIGHLECNSVAKIRSRYKMQERNPKKEIIPSFLPL